MKKEKLALVLSGGSAYGFAHIGVIKALLEHGIVPDIVVGTSMGAIIGGLFAGGVTVEEMESTLSHFSRNKIVDFSLFSLFKKGMLHGGKVTHILQNFLGEKNIEDCSISFACIASDLKSGEKVVFSSGNMVSSIRSSMSIPGIFTPVEMGDMLLVDGGLCDNLPVDVARSMGADKVIAVDVCTFYQQQNDLSSTIDIVISACNLCVSKAVLAQEDKGDVYIKIDQPNISFDKFTSKDILTSIDNGYIACHHHMGEVLELVKMESEER